MDCLEDHLNELNLPCREAVQKNAEDVEENPELDKIFANSCRQFWMDHCKVSYTVCVVIIIHVPVSRETMYL